MEVKFMLKNLRKLLGRRPFYMAQNLPLHSFLGTLESSSKFLWAVLQTEYSPTTHPRVEPRAIPGLYY
jgi:hypothetical protein